MKYLLFISMVLSFAFIAKPVEKTKPRYCFENSISISNPLYKEVFKLNQPIDTPRLFVKKSLNLRGKNIYWFGDSITRGYGATDTAHRYSTLYSLYVGAVEYNYGTDGMTITPNGCGNYFNPANIPTYNSATDGLLVLAFGTNDIGAAGNLVFITPAAVEAAMRVALNIAINGKLWPASKILVISPYYSLSYNAFIGACSGNITIAATQSRSDSIILKIEKPAQDYKVRLLPAKYLMKDAVFDAPDFLIDSVHPRNLGNAKLFQLLKKYF